MTFILTKHMSPGSVQKGNPPCPDMLRPVLPHVRSPLFKEACVLFSFRFSFEKVTRSIPMSR